MLELVASASAILGLAVLVWRFVAPGFRRFTRYLDWQDQFRVDWQGEPARAGRDATLGVMERLNRLDGELSHNGGTSVKDVVEAMQRDVCKIDKRLAKLEKSQDNLNKILLQAVK
jgi:hypothetical protein